MVPVINNLLRLQLQLLLAFRHLPSKVLLFPSFMFSPFFFETIGTRQPLRHLLPTLPLSILTSLLYFLVAGGGWCALEPCFSDPLLL